ncbi:MAG: DotI/IcmL/TraM family protein [Micavibrio sp.]|nr:DotI/IcmL/TraM family protein [Micavibrio sp.]
MPTNDINQITHFTPASIGYAERLEKANTLVEDLSSYRDGFKNLIRLAIMMGFVMIIMTGVVIYYVSYVIPQDGYYAISALSNGSELKRPMDGLASPNVNTDAMLRWAASAATEVMTFGFTDIDERMTKSRRLFTTEGWDSFTSALVKTSMIKNMLEFQQILATIPAAEPRKISEGLYNGDYTWVLEMPVIMTLRAGDKVTTARAKIRLIVVRMPTESNPMGIGIKTWMAY